MVEIQGVPEGIDVTAQVIHGQKTEGIRGDDGVWYIETEKPMIPGIPHIYRVTMKAEGSRRFDDDDVRYVRFIYGRIVELRY